MELLITDRRKVGMITRIVYHRGKERRGSLLKSKKCNVPTLKGLKRQDEEKINF